MPKKNQIVIVVSGGVVCDVFSTNPNNVEVILRDFDVEGSEGDAAERGNLHRVDGDYCSEFVFDVSEMKYLDTVPFHEPISLEDLENEVNEFKDESEDESEE